MNNVLSLQGVCKRFGGVVVADQITLELKAGEILGLIGPNGAGKTSLFNLISGVFPADSGAISVEGRLLSGMSLHARDRTSVVAGKSVSVRVELGGRRIFKKKKK